MERLDLFATPVFVLRLHDDPAVARLDAEAAAKLVAESEATPGIVRSNTGGWHSVPDLAQRPDPCFRALTERIAEIVHGVASRVNAEAGGPHAGGRFGLGIHGWAMVMRDGDYTSLHHHDEAHWSLAYYLDAGDADRARWPESGALAIVDPRRSSVRGARGDLGTTFTIRPETGMVVVFPGFAQHYVHAYRGARPRVCASFNVVCRPE